MNESALDGLRRQTRLVMILDAAEKAGLSPVPVRRLHKIAYFANVLAPIWDMPPLDGKLLKRRGGPFYPGLQTDLDGLVGIGLAAISGLTHVLDEEKRWRLEGSYALNYGFGEPILRRLKWFEDEEQLRRFIEEIGLALSSLSDFDFDGATMEDATYSDPMVDIGNVIDFAEWNDINFSANAAQELGTLLPDHSIPTIGEKLHLYVRHLSVRISGGK